MGVRIRNNIKCAKKTVTPAKMRIKSNDNSTEFGNSMDSLVTKVSKETPRGQIVTPLTFDHSLINKRTNISEPRRPVVRKLSLPSINEVSDEEETSSDDLRNNKQVPFSFPGSRPVQPNTRKVYSIVSRMTGSIGGNGNGGAIYGELTIRSMQKMVDLMKVHTNFNENSRFIDVGCGLGKPNLHVAQDPGVQFSYGIEMERVRWLLGMCNLNKVFDEALRQSSNKIDKKTDLIGHRCVIEHGDITDADYFDPFTHVYMFDIGFPPKLFKRLATMFNRSESPYLICYHSPRVMIKRYGFDVELIIQSPTSMHGSSEGHMGYIYRRVQCRNRIKKKCPMVMNDNMEAIPCDPMFISAWKSSRCNVEDITMGVKKVVVSNLSSCRSTRNSAITPAI